MGLFDFKKNSKHFVQSYENPDIDGIRVYFNGEDEKKSNIHIVALTGHAYGKSRQLCLNAGMQSVYSKPASLEDLKKALDYFSAG